MVNITVKTSKDKVISISAIGHANYAPNGQDIVCSAISAVLAGGFNALQGKHKIKIESGNTSYECGNYLSIHDEHVLETIVTQLLSIQESYQKNISVVIEEV